jgi:hypothetical protein
VTETQAYVADLLALLLGAGATVDGDGNLLVPLVR